jgi:hypothetical protein
MATDVKSIQWILSAVDRASPVFRGIETSMDRINIAHAKLAAVMGVVAAGGIFAQMRQEAMEAEQASNRLSAVLIATGQSAGLTKKQIDDLADSLAKTTQFDDESIRNAASTFIKFGNIQGDVLKQGMKYAADWAAFTGSAMPEAAQAIGKALQSPTEGLKAVERETGKLTYTEKKNIETLMEQGRLFEAQAAVLKVLEQRIGGVAEKMNTGLTKQSADLNKNFKELLETLGKSSGGSSFIDFLNDSLRDTKRIIEAGDWVAALKFMAGFRGMNIKEPNVNSVSGPIRGTAGDPEVGARIAQLNAQFEAAAKRQDELQKKREQDAIKAAEEARRQKETLLKQGAADWAKYADAVFQNAEELDNALAKMHEARNEHDAALLREEIAIEARVVTQGIENTQRWDDQMRKLTDDVEKTEGFMKSLGFTMASGFEDAIVKGKDFRSVLQGIAQDILKIMTRKMVSDPLAEFATGSLSSIFGGRYTPKDSSNADSLLGSGFQDGNIEGGLLGAYAAGTTSVPRTGPYLLHAGESVSKSGAGGGTVVQNVTINQGSGSNVQEMLALLLPAMQSTAQSVIINQKRPGGLLAG